jgi:hypothetical protein
MNFIKRKDYTEKGCQMCSERRLHKNGKQYYCIHEKCIFEDSEDLKWWKEVGGKNLIPEGATV